MSVDLFSYQRSCIQDAMLLRDKVVNILKEEAHKESSASMTEGDAMLEATHLIGWGIDGFNHEISQLEYNKDPRIEPLIKILIKTNEHYFSSEFFFSGDLQNILQRKA
mgnify:CR=1 FL=1